MGAICRKVATEVARGSEKPVKVTIGNLHKYLGPPRFRFGVAEKEDEVGASTGLVYTEMGGDIVSIEATLMPGDGELTLTGQLGDVMKESAQAALSYVRSRARRLGLAEDFYQRLDVHIHVPAVAVPKDGPSAGITMAVALASALTGRTVKRDVAMTGEITLRGRVLPIGGLQGKGPAADRAGLRAGGPAGPLPAAPPAAAGAAQAAGGPTGQLGRGRGVDRGSKREREWGHRSVPPLMFQAGSRGYFGCRPKAWYCIGTR